MICRTVLLQFFALVYTWASRNADGMQAFFTQPENHAVVQQSMTTLIGAMKAYDSDKSMRLSRVETDGLFRDQFSAHYSNYERAVTDLNPQVSPLMAKLQRPPLAALSQSPIPQHRQSPYQTSVSSPE